MASNKTVIAALALGGLYLFLRGKEEVKNTIAGLSFTFGPAGWPKLIGLTQIEIPVKVTVNNVGFTELPLQGLNLTLNRLNYKGEFDHAFAATDPAGVATPAIKARGTTTFVVPLRTEPLAAIGEIWTTFQKRGMNRFSATGTVQAAGLSLPIQPVTFNL